MILLMIYLNFIIYLLIKYIYNLFSHFPNLCLYLINRPYFILKLIVSKMINNGLIIFIHNKIFLC